VVYPTTVGTFTMGIVPVDSNCRPPGEIFVDACLMARSGDILYTGGGAASCYSGNNKEEGTIKKRGTIRPGTIVV
jgi:hypothetical protein